MTPEQVAAAVGAAWAHDHAMEAGRQMLFRASSRLHGLANELVDVAVGARVVEDLSSAARTVMNAAEKASA